MTGATPALSHRLRPIMAAIWLSTSIGAASVLTAAPALARGPDGIADVAEKVIDAVVNISTSQTVEAKGGPALARPGTTIALGLKRLRDQRHRERLPSVFRRNAGLKCLRRHPVRAHCGF